MANTAKNRLFYGDMGFYNTQGKTMAVLAHAFLVSGFTSVTFRIFLKGFFAFRMLSVLLSTANEIKKSTQG
jgi:hypothetical protein